MIPYLKLVLGFIEITDVETIRAEAESFGPEKADKGIAAALAQAKVVSIAGTEAPASPLSIGQMRAEKKYMLETAKIS